MCGACWTHWVDSEPWCASCVELLDQPVSWLAYVAGAVLATSLLWIGAARVSPFLLQWTVLGIGVLAIGIAAWRMHGRAESRRAGFSVKVRSPDAEPPRGTTEPRGYREGRAPLRVQRLAPPVSGALTALIVGSMMALVAVTFPALLQLPRWLEIEIVLALWWGVWSVTFVVLLYRGWRVARDLKSIKGKPRPKHPGRTTSFGNWFDFSGGVDLDGCVFVLGLALAIGAAFLLAELIVPVLLIGAYWLIVRGLTTVANDSHRCEGQLGRALLWGTLWSTGYTAPLAILVWIGHWILGTG